MTHTNPPPPKGFGETGPPPSNGSAGAGPLHGSVDDPLQNPDVAHEHSDVNVRVILLSGFALLAAAAIVHVLMWGLFRVFERQAAANEPEVSPLAAPATQMPPTTTGSPYFGTAVGPQLLTNEPAALQKQRAAEQERLHGYGWVNQSAGVAHIPIEEAKKLIAERGLPVREDGAADPALGTHAAAMGEASSGRTVPTGRRAVEPAQAPTGSEQSPAQRAPQPPKPQTGH